MDLRNCEVQIHTTGSEVPWDILDLSSVYDDEWISLQIHFRKPSEHFLKYSYNIIHQNQLSKFLEQLKKPTHLACYENYKVEKHIAYYFPLDPNN